MFLELLALCYINKQVINLKMCSFNFVLKRMNDIVHQVICIPPTSVQNKAEIPGPFPDLDSATMVTLYNEPGYKPRIFVLRATLVNCMCFGVNR